MPTNPSEAGGGLVRTTTGDATKPLGGSVNGPDTDSERLKASAADSVASANTQDAANGVSSNAAGAQSNARQSVDKKESQTNASYVNVDISSRSHDYLIELFAQGTSGGKPTAAVRLPFVSSFEAEQPNAVTRTWTMAGTPYEEHSGFKQRMFRIRGRSGYSTLHLKNFAKLRNLLEDYGKSASETMNAFYRAQKDKRTKLRFSALWEGEIWDATVISFKYQRDVASTRTSYNYELLLATNGLSGERWSPDIPVYTGQDGGTDRLEDSTDIFNEGYYYAINNVLKAPPEFSQDAKTKILRLAEIIKSAKVFDWQFWYRVLLLSRDTIATLYYEKRISTSQQLGLRDLIMAGLRWALDISTQAETIFGAAGRYLDVQKIKLDDVPANTNLQVNPQPTPNNGVPVLTVVVSQGQASAFDIAAVYLGNRNYWTAVTEVNRMPDARTKADGSPLIPGDRIIIPSPNGLRDIDPDTFYGRNLLFRDGDLVAVGNDTDIATVSGLANYYQNFRHRMLTTVGHNRTYPDFGLSPLVGSSETSDLAGQVYSNVLRQTLSDHRVSNVTEMNMTTDAGNIDVKMSIITALQEKTKVGFSYPF
jgi:hypothetical protein